MMGKHKIGEEFYLDLRKDKLMAWECEKGALVIAAMIEGIKLKHEFPAVDVVRNGRVYELIYGIDPTATFIDGDRRMPPWQYGGHNRALAHYIENIPLKCKLLKGHRDDISDGKFISLEEVTIGERKYATIGEIEYNKGRLKNSLSHLPRDVAERFCEENNLNVGEYLSQ